MVFSKMVHFLIAHFIPPFVLRQTTKSPSCKFIKLIKVSSAAVECVMCWNGSLLHYEMTYEGVLVNDKVKWKLPGIGDPASCWLQTLMEPTGVKTVLVTTNRDVSEIIWSFRPNQQQSEANSAVCNPSPLISCLKADDAAQTTGSSSTYTLEITVPLDDPNLTSTASAMISTFFSTTSVERTMEPEEEPLFRKESTEKYSGF